MIGGKNLRSPSRMQAPKKYTTTPTNITSPTATMSATPRTPNKQLHTTPKKTLPANRWVQNASVRVIVALECLVTNWAAALLRNCNWIVEFFFFGKFSRYFFIIDRLSESFFLVLGQKWLKVKLFVFFFLLNGSLNFSRLTWIGKCPPGAAYLWFVEFISVASCYYAWQLPSAFVLSPRTRFRSFDTRQQVPTLIGDKSRLSRPSVRMLGKPLWYFPITQTFRTECSFVLVCREIRSHLWSDCNEIKKSTNPFRSSWKLGSILSTCFLIKLFHFFHCRSSATRTR